MASCSSAGRIPTVESVTRRGCTPQAFLVGQDAERFHRRVVVVERLAHAHEDDVERRTGEAGVVREHPDLPGDFAGREVPRESHFSGETEAASDRAPDLRRDAERLRGRVGDVDGFDLTAVGEAQQEFRRPVHGRLAGGDRGRLERERRGKLFAQVLAEVAHRGEIGDAAPVDPVQDLPAPVTRRAEIRESLLELLAIEILWVRFHVWRPGIGNDSTGMFCDIISLLTLAAKVKPVNNLELLRTGPPPARVSRWSLKKRCRPGCGW